MAGRARPPGAVLPGMITVNFLVTAHTRGLRRFSDVMRTVATRADAMVANLLSAESLVRPMTIRTGCDPSSIEVVALMAARTAFVASREDRPCRDHGRGLSMTGETGPAHILGAFVRPMTIETLLVARAGVLRARPMVQADVRVAIPARHRIDATIPVGVVTIETRLIRVYDDRRASPLRVFMTLDALIGSMKGRLNRSASQIEWRLSIPLKRMAACAIVARAATAVMKRKSSVTSIARRRRRLIKLSLTHRVTIHAMHSVFEVRNMAGACPSDREARVDLRRPRSVLRLGTCRSPCRAHNRQECEEVAELPLKSPRVHHV